MGGALFGKKFGCLYRESLKHDWSGPPLRSVSGPPLMKISGSATDIPEQVKEISGISTLPFKGLNCQVSMKSKMELIIKDVLG